MFALLSMIYVPRPAYQLTSWWRGHPAHYSFIFSQEDTRIAFSQLLVNVGFAALLGAILATVWTKMSRRALYVIGGCIGLVAAAWFTYDAWDKNAHEACSRAEADEAFADKLISDAGRWQNVIASVQYSAQEIAQKVAAFRALAKEKRLLAADNWHIALDFAKEKRARERAQEKMPDYVSTDPFGKPNAKPEVSPRQRAPFDPSTATLLDEASPRSGSPLTFDDLIPTRRAAPQKSTTASPANRPP